MIFSGDHVLPRISPHIALELPGPPNPLADYYESLDLIGFEDAMEVCPAHEFRFSGMQRRVAQLVKHNCERSAEILRVLEAHRPGTVWDIARHLTWSRAGSPCTPSRCAWRSPKRPATSFTCAHRATTSPCPSQNHVRLLFSDGSQPGKVFPRTGSFRDESRNSPPGSPCAPISHPGSERSSTQSMQAPPLTPRPGDQRLLTGPDGRQREPGSAPS
jgi:hypothetical protein